MFGDDGAMLPEIRQGLLQIAQDIAEDLAEGGHSVMPEWVHLVGSLAGRQWTEESDLDLHYGVDLSSADDPELLKKYLALYAKVWNEQKYVVGGHTVELYFQAAEEPHSSPGIYDVTHGTWLQSPDPVLPRSEDVERAAAALAGRVGRLESQYARWPRTKAKEFLGKVAAQWQFLRKMRKTGQAQGGYPSFGNQLFRTLRHNGTIESLLDLLHRVRQDEYAPGGGASA